MEEDDVVAQLEKTSDSGVQGNLLASAIGAAAGLLLAFIVPEQPAPIYVSNTAFGALYGFLLYRRFKAPLTAWTLQVITKARRSKDASLKALLTLILMIATFVVPPIAWRARFGAAPAPSSPSAAASSGTVTVPTPTIPPTRGSELVVALNAGPSVPSDGIDTGIDLVASQTILISASGRISYGLEGEAGCAGVPVTEPDGRRYLPDKACEPKADSNPSASAPGYPIGMLLARIDGGNWFPIGSYFMYKLPASGGGRLYLQYNEVTRSDDTGGYRVVINVF